MPAWSRKGPEFRRRAWVLVLCLGVAMAAASSRAEPATDPARAVVTVVGLDGQGEPRRQGLGVLLGRDGWVLTSASLLLPGGSAVVRTGEGAKHLVRGLLPQDALQDLAVLKLEAGGLPGVAVGLPGRLHPGGTVQVGVPQAGGLVLAEARVTSLHPFSPRLTLVKLTPSFPEAAPGTPLFDARGTLVGMVHAFAGGEGLGPPLRLVLVRDANLLPIQEWGEAGRKGAPPLKKGTTPPPGGAKSTDPSAQAPPAADPGHPPTDPEGLAVAPAYRAFWQGVKASLDGAWRQAQEHFTAARGAGRGLPEASFGRGVACYHLQDDVGAIKDFLEATRGLPHYPLAFWWLGKAWERRGNRTAAQEAYQQAVNQAPEFHAAWYALGFLAYQEGRLDQAEEWLTRAGDQGDQEARRAFSLGAIARRRGRLEQARAWFAAAVQRDPGFLPAYLEGGKTLLDLGEAREATRLLAELTRRDPRLPLARYYLALAHQAAWNPRQAWEQYLVLQQLDPTLASRLATVLEGGR